MSERNLKRLVMVLVAVVVLYGALYAWSRTASDGRGGDERVAAALGEIDPDWVDRIEVTGPADTVTLDVSGAPWTANGYRADSAAVSRIWTALAESEVDGLAGSNPANHERFGVAGPDAWSVRFAGDDGAETNLILGNRGTRFSSSYVRLPDEDAVVNLLGDLRGAVARTMDQWRDRSIASVDTAAVTTLDLERDGEGLRMVRADSSWTSDRGSVVPETVRGMLEELTSLSASGFADDSVSVTDADVRVLIALSASGDTLAHLRGTASDRALYVIRDGDPVVYEVATWRADRLFPEVDGLVGGG